MFLEKELKEAFSVKLQIEGLVFCKIKIKQNPGYPNKQYNVTFKHIHQDISVHSRI